MSQQPETPNLLDPFGTWRGIRDTSLESWSRMLIDLVNSDTYSHTTSQWLDITLTLSQPFQQILERTMTQVLAGLNMPTRAEITRLAERLTNVETRLDDLDGKLDDIQCAVEMLSAPPQPVEAKEAP
jgi:hypothetical protein